MGNQGVIIYTEDDGVNWNSQSSGTNALLTSIAFAAASYGWIVGRSGTILHTQDGGIRWKVQQAYDLDGPLNFIDFVRSQ